MTVPCSAQNKRGETKISQQLRPDCSIQSTTILTKVFARERNALAWTKIYESEVAVTKTQHAKEVQQTEQEKAKVAARRWENGDAQLEPEALPAEPAFTK